MRILLVSGLLLATAACALPPQQQGANCPYARAAVAAAHAPPPAAPPRVAPAPAPHPAPVPRPVAAAAPAPTPVVAVYPALPTLDPGRIPSDILTDLFGPGLPVVSLGPQPAGRLTLNNFTYDLADVQALVTRYPDCAVHPGMAPLAFKLPLNSTWIVPAPPGSDVCWRRAMAPAPVAAGTAPGWTDWNRAFTASGTFVQSQL